jgi:hypothetical protein
MNNTENDLSQLSNYIPHPIDHAIAFWVSRNSLYTEFFYRRKFVSHLVKVVKSCPFNMKFFEDQSESFIDGLVVFSEGYSRSIPSSIQYGEDLMKPMIEEVMGYLSSESFQKFVLSQHITGEERVPVMIPEILISVNELILFLRREKSIVLEIEDVNKLKQRFILDKIDGWGLRGEFGRTIKFLEHFVHPEIFNPNGFLIFSYLMESQKSYTRGAIEDISYFFHQLAKEGYIHAGRDKFRKWFNSHYLDFPDIEKIHNGRSRVPFGRSERYFQALEFIKSKEV